MEVPARNADVTRLWPQLARLLCALAAVQSAATAIWLLRIPSSAEALLPGMGLSPRAILLPAALAVTIALAYLGVRLWKDERLASEVGRRLFGDQGFVPHLLLYAVLAIIAVIAAAILLWPDHVLETSLASVRELAPAAAWLGLLMGELGACWAWISLRDRLRLSPRALDVSAVFFLFALALAARVPMTGYGLPYSNVWDEVVTYGQAMNMLTVPGLDQVSNVPGYGLNAYGDLLVYITAAGETVGLLDAFRNSRVSTIREYVSPPRGVSSIYEAVHPSGIPLRYPRLLLSLLTSLAPPILYLLMRKHFRVSRPVALGSALVFAVFSRDVIYLSSYILPDSLAATLFILVLFAAFDGIADESDRLSPWLASAVFAGMTVSVTIRDLPVIIVPFIAFALAHNHDRPYTKLVVLASGVTLGFVATSPYAVLDLPTYLGKVTSFTWIQDWTIVHRLKSLVFYFRGMFAQGFDSGYVDTAEGSVGMGALVGVLALVGAGRAASRYPRLMALILAFSLVHLYTISTVVRWYTRHALILYPLACILAGVGMSAVADLARRWLTSFRGARLASWSGAAPALVLGVFLALSIRQLQLTYRFVERTTEFEPSQVRAAEFLEQTLGPDDKVGILDRIPWVEADLVQRGISFERVGAADSLDDLRDQGFTYVVGSDLVGGHYTDLQGNVWGDYYSRPGTKLAEFGHMKLQYTGFPSGSLYLFVGRIPETSQ